MLPVTRAIRELSAEQPVEQAATLEDIRADVQTPDRLNAVVFGGFAAVALAIAVVGVAGVLAFLVSRRTREFGIRLALGATRTDVVTSVLRHGAILIAIGTVIGAAVAGGLYRLFSAQLFEVTAMDMSSALAVLSLVAVAMLACLVPAMRATRVDPVSALRS